MARYYFNLRRDDMVFEDHTGAALPGIAEAWEWGLREALTLNREGWLELGAHRYWIEVCDAHHCAIVSFPIGRITEQ